MEATLISHRVDLVVLAGFVRTVGPRVLKAFAGQILNTHPAPLPRFGGKGMYGEHVHRAVLDAGVQESAATVHLVDGEYDSGPVIATQPVPVIAGDDVANLRARVQAPERELLITTLSRLTAQHRPASQPERSWPLWRSLGCLPGDPEVPACAPGSANSNAVHEARA